MIDDLQKSANHSPPSEIRHGARLLARDVVTLVELQSELLYVDFHNWLRTGLTPMVLGVATAVIAALASLPVLLFSLAYYLVEAADWTLPTALLAASGVGLGIALVAALLAWVAARRSRGAFERFRVELTQNLAWLKQVLGHPVETAEQFTPDAVRRPPR